MNYNKGITYKAPFYKKTQKEVLDTNENYNKFINWVSGEFDLHIQEESLGLKVYLPNGWFSISRNSSEHNKHEMEIRIHAKSIIACENIKNKLDNIYSHFIKLQRNKELV